MRGPITNAFGVICNMKQVLQSPCLNAEPTVAGACAGACAVVVAGVLEGRTERSARVDLPGGPLQVWVQAVSSVLFVCRSYPLSGLSALDADRARLWVLVWVKFCPEQAHCCKLRSTDRVARRGRARVHDGASGAGFLRQLQSGVSRELDSCMLCISEPQQRPSIGSKRLLMAGHLRAAVCAEDL